MTGPRPPEPTKEILNIDEAALLLGVSTKTFAKVLREGQIPGRKIGREWKFARRALIDWVASGRSREFLEVDDRGSDHKDRRHETSQPGAGHSRVARQIESEMSIEED